MHKTTKEGEAFLDRILENAPPLEPLHIEPMLSHEEVSSVKAEPTLSIQEPSPELEDPKEGFQPLDLPPFEDDLFEDFGNTSKYSCQKQPPVHVTPLDSLDKEFLSESIRELTAIMSSEWVEEVEGSSEEIQIYAPPSSIHCKVLGTMVDVLYSPTAGANKMSESFAHAYFGDEPLASTNKSLRNAPRTILKGHGILHNTMILYNNAVIALDFHVFDIQDFDIMIGHPLATLFIEPLSSGDLDVKIGRSTFSIPRNSVADTLPYPKPPKEVMLVSPFESPESSLEKDAKLFIKEEDDLGKTIDLPQEEAPV